MGGSLNKVMLIGNLGKDPEVRSFQNGNKVCNFSLATTESWKDKSSGERKEATTWHSIAVFNENLVGIAEKYLKKGSKIYIEGSLQTRKYSTQDGTEKYVTEVVLQNYDGTLVLLGDGAGKSGEQSNRRDASATKRSAPASRPGAFDGDLDDSDLPF